MGEHDLERPLMTIRDAYDVEKGNAARFRDALQMLLVNALRDPVALAPHVATICRDVLSGATVADVVAALSREAGHGG